MHLTNAIRNAQFSVARITVTQFTVAHLTVADFTDPTKKWLPNLPLPNFPVALFFVAHFTVAQFIVYRFLGLCATIVETAECRIMWFFTVVFEGWCTVHTLFLGSKFYTKVHWKSP